jgi:hypothetical protein
MKNRKKQPQERNIRFNQNKPTPQNKESLDSREGEEQLFKGDDITHNVKDRHNKPNRTKH